mmetsp:Transcript_131515/g.281151  ORF Transcript_131515/g.281151 Transcript_131515/m.281151 type:complete len:151 (+) Transcript_131515:66-518(+)
MAVGSPTMPPGSEGGCDGDNSQPVADDLAHYREHYRDFFSELEVLYVSQDRQQAEFRLVSRAEDRRALRVTLSPSCFCVEEDSRNGELKGEQLESFEQLLSAMDGAATFGSRLCGLVSAQLAQQLNSSDLAARLSAGGGGQDEPESGEDV